MPHAASNNRCLRPSRKKGLQKVKGRLTSRNRSIYNVVCVQGSEELKSMNSRFTAFIAQIKTQRWLSTLVVLATLTLGILIGTVVSKSGVKGNSTPSADATLLPMQSPQQLSNTFRQVAKQLEPSVVNINSETNAKQPLVRRRNPHRQAPGQGGGGDDPFQDFFDRFFGGQGQGQGGQGGQGGQ